MREKTGLLLMVCAALAPELISPVWAAEATASGSDELTEIIVTARRTEERLQDVPISITVFNQQQLSNRNVISAQDLAAYTPSLSVDTNFGSQNSSFAIRGFVQDTGTAPSVGVFFADVIAPRAASNGLPGGDGAGPGSFFDLENVQILKGPQGTLFGRNTTGGDILLVPKKPTSELSGYVEGGVGNYKDGNFQAVGNVPINDNLRVRAGVIHESREGYLHSNSGIGPNNFDDVNYTAFRLSVVADILPNLENYTIGTYSSANTHGDIGKLIASGPPASSFFPFFADAAKAQLVNQGSGFYDIQQDLQNPYSRLEQWQAINTTTWKTSDNLTIKNIASYAQLRDSLNNGLFATDFSVVGGALNGVPFSFAASEPLPGSETASEHTVTEELQFQGTALNERLTWQGGGYFELALPAGIVGSQSPVSAHCIDSRNFNCSDVLGSALGSELGLPLGVGILPVGAENLTIGTTKYRDFAFYTQETYKFTDQFKLTAGARWSNDHEETQTIQKTYHFKYYPAFGLVPDSTGNPNPKCTDANAVLPTCQVNYSETTHAPTWLIDLDYTPIQDLLVYAKYARGYREGTIAPTAPPPLNVIEPEKVDSYEIGEKFSFHGPVSGTANLTAFYNDFRNQQVQVGYNASQTSGLGPFAAPANVGKSRIWGVEADASLRLFAGMRLDVGYTYLNTEIRQVQIPVLPATSPYFISGNQHAGDPLPLSPRNKVSVTPSYTLPLPDTLGEMTFGATFTHTDRQLVNYDDRNDGPIFASLSFIGSTDLLNLNFNWNSIMNKPVDVTAFATNVTGKQYYTYVAGLAGGTAFETASIGAPCFVGVRLRLRFH